MKSYTNVNETVTVRKPYLGPINIVLSSTNLTTPLQSKRMWRVSGRRK